MGRADEVRGLVLLQTGLVTELLAGDSVEADILGVELTRVGGCLPGEHQDVALLLSEVTTVSPHGNRTGNLEDAALAAELRNVATAGDLTLGDDGFTDVAVGTEKKIDPPGLDSDDSQLHVPASEPGSVIGHVQDARVLVQEGGQHLVTVAPCQISS